MRLGEGFRDTPKGLIPFRDTTLIERSLSLIKAAGVNRTVIVTGHCAEMYEALARSSSGFVTTLFNDRYADRGSLVSLSVALAAVQGPCLILDSDIVYDGRGLAALLASAEPYLAEDVVESFYAVGRRRFCERRKGDCCDCLDLLLVILEATLDNAALKPQPLKLKP